MTFQQNYRDKIIWQGKNKFNSKNFINIQKLSKICKALLKKF